MKTVRELLQDADPLRDDPRASATDREHIRAAVLAAARTSAAPHGHSFVSRRFAILAVVAAATGAAVMGPRFWSGAATLHAAAVRFEARLAETAPTLDLQPVKIDPNRTIYLHREAIVTNDDIAAARVVPGNAPGQFHVAVTFTPTGAERMRAATAEHIGRLLALLIDGQVVMAPTIRSVVSAEALLTGNYTQEEADRIANGMLLR